MKKDMKAFYERRERSIAVFQESGSEEF